MNDQEKFDKRRNEMALLFDAMREQLDANSLERKFTVSRHMRSDTEGDQYISFGAVKIRKIIIGCLSYCEILEEDGFLEEIDERKYRMLDDFCEMLLSWQREN